MVVKDKLIELDKNNFNPGGRLMKHDHVRDTFLNGFHPIDLIHAAPHSALAANTNSWHTFTVISNDSAIPFGHFFQDSVSPSDMEGLEELHNNIIFYFAIALLSVAWMFVSLIIHFARSCIFNIYKNNFTSVDPTLAPPL